MLHCLSLYQFSYAHSLDLCRISNGGRMVTLAQLETQIQKLQRRADALRERKSSEVIANIRALMQEYGLTTADLDKSDSSPGVKKRGRPVGSKNVASSRKAVKKSKMPPKYRDPASGLTWSGHARPPAWIKDVADRSVYLIDGASNGKTGARRDSPAGSSKAAGAKSKARPAGKKAASVQEAST
ncbi:MULTISPECIES: H-NS histone family protein [unclassified Caballeronia]|uniref:H-NS histone family protein n=2 Tax=Caballeronia TaxID=1827195 RepID=UPI002856131D|nr:MULTISPECIES: H-NS histone family protein [unclassified Caballeronia]MDR5774105.1 H-NS histone family protein [Caballeronia sp. LZ002]MDR5849540.1 H-NS histone family protein [Caballeronia sp. LZ003]